MKKFILNFKQTIRFTASIIASREFAFVYCIIGTIGQIAHTFYLANSISSLEGNWKTVQAVMLSIFISSSLLYFTAISEDSDTKEAKKIHFAVTMFTIIEILINIYYYSRHLLIDQETYQIFDFIFAVLISCLIPVTIKLYSSHIRAKEWIIDIEHDRKAFVSDFESEEKNSTDNSLLSEDKVKELINPFIEQYQEEITQLRAELQESINPDNIEKINLWFENKIATLDNEISKSFEKNKDLFLTQFENKIKLIIKQKTNEIQTS